MTTEIIGTFEIKQEDLKNLACLQYKDKRIYLGKEQKWELSKSNKTIYIVQYDKEKTIGKKGFRISSCLFYAEYYD